MSYSSEVLADSPLAYYRLADTSGTAFVDSSGNSRDGGYVNVPILDVASLLLSDANTAADFDGTNDYGTIADGAWMDVSTITLEAWVRFDNTASASEVFLSRWSSVSGNQVWIMQRTSAGKLQFDWKDSGGTTRTLTGSTTLAANTTYHLVATVDSVGVGTVYVNGVSDGTLDPAGSLTVRTSATSSIFLGAHPPTPSLFTNGKIDEVAIYGSALSSTRVDVHYDAGVYDGIVIVGQAVETDSALAATVAVGAVVVVGQALETDSALAASVVNGVIVSVGQAVETDSALTATVAAGAVIVVGQAAETDSALAATVVGGGETVVVGIAIEADSALSVTVVYGHIDTDTDNNVYALMFTGDGDLVWEPAVVARPALLARGDYIQAQTSARKIDSYTLSPDGTLTYDDTVVSTPRHRDRIVIGSTDFTFTENFPLQVPDFELLDPFMYGDGGTLVLPWSSFRYEKLGVGLGGRLKRVRLGAEVKYQRVDDDPDSPTYNQVVATDYKGVVIRTGRADGDKIALAVGGELLGRAALKWHPVPIFRRLRDAGIHLFNVVVGLGLRYTPRLDTLGITLAGRGGMYEDQYLLDTVSQLVTNDGDQWTVMPTASGAYTHQLKDLTTVHATVYFDNEFATPDLGDDLAEKPNRVWINALAPDGQRIMHASAPNLQATAVPTLPTVGGFPMTIGDEDVDTSTGDGVTVLVWRLTFAGLLDREDLPGGFDADVRDAVVDFQRSAGMANLAGSVDEDTWNALWDNAITGYSTAHAAQRPAVEDDAVQKFDRAGSGSIIGRHEGYDETAIVVDLPLDMGPVGSRRRAFKMARHKLHSVGETDWVGTITLTDGLISGTHNPGNPLTASQIIPSRAVRPGWNIWEPYFDGGTLFPVVACRVRDNGWVVELLVDTRARPAMEAWAVHQRNRENRYQPSRYLGGPRRRSTSVMDTVTPWDKIVGQTDRDWPLAAGEWTEIPVPAGQAGTVQRTEIALDKAIEFAAMVSERPIPLGRLNRTIEPLLEPATDPQRHHIDIAGRPTGGTFTLSGNSNTTGAITYGASAGAVQAVIRTLGGAFATSTVAKLPSSGDYTVTMPSSLDLDVGTNSLTGGSPTISVTTTGPGSGPGTPWYGKPAIRNWLKPYGAKVSWGTFENPCGYGDWMKAHPQTGLATAAPLTGEFVDDDSWGYDCGLHGAVLYLYIWVGQANTLPRQRVFTQQLDGSGT